MVIFFASGGQPFEKGWTLNFYLAIPLTCVVYL